MENWEKYLYCYKMIIFKVTVLKFSENMYIITKFVKNQKYSSIAEKR